MVEDARRPNGQAHHDTRVENAPGRGREPLDEGHDHGHAGGHPPRDDQALGGGPPQSHAVEGSQQKVDRVVPLAGPNDEGEGALDHQRGEFFVESLVALGVGKKEAAQCVEAPLDRRQSKGGLGAQGLQGDGKDPKNGLGQNVNDPKGSPEGPKGRRKAGKGARRRLSRCRRK